MTDYPIDAEGAYNEYEMYSVRLDRFVTEEMSELECFFEKKHLVTACSAGCKYCKILMLNFHFPLHSTYEIYRCHKGYINQLTGLFNIIFDKVW